MISKVILLSSPLDSFSGKKRFTVIPFFKTYKIKISIKTNAIKIKSNVLDISNKIGIKKPITKSVKSENIYILIGSFYTKEAANLLKKRINLEQPDYDTKRLKIRKKSINEFEVLSGPYKSVNSLKNDYIYIKNFGFEELDIFIND